MQTGKVKQEAYDKLLLLHDRAVPSCTSGQDSTTSGQGRGTAGQDLASTSDRDSTQDLSTPAEPSPVGCM